MQKTLKSTSTFWVFQGSLFMPHYSKSQIFVQIQFRQNSQHFHEFFTQIFLTIFLVKSNLSTAKKSKTTTFSRVFHPKKNRQFSREFLDKNEDLFTKKDSTVN